LAAAGFVVFIGVLFIGIYLTLFGLPGNLLIFLDVLIYALLTDLAIFGWKVLLFLFVVAIVAEAIDVLLGMTQTHKVPVIKQSLWGAAIGAACGMAVLTPFFWGPGVWGGFFLGGLAGLVIMELFRQSRLKVPYQALPSTFAAMIGKKALKGLFALTMIVVSLSNIYS
jgi:hypothetical protein